MIGAVDGCDRSEENAMDAQPKDDKVQEPVADVAETGADVEGHSVFSAIAASGALRPRAPHEGQATRSKTDEDLPPLTRPFPSMRDDRRK
jgi:hypothetical protein